VWNDGFSDACIGTATVPLRPAGLKFGQLVEIPSVFMDKKGKIVLLTHSLTRLLTHLLALFLQVK